jgi:hypothetical protein
MSREATTPSTTENQMTLHIVYGDRHHFFHLGRRIAQQTIALGASLVFFPIAMGADLSGTVQRGGRPVGGVSVKLDPARPPATGPTRTSTSDQSGRYRFTGLIPGDYLLSCGGRPVLKTAVRDRADNRTDCDL